jgi:hypothetical protein
VARDQPLPVVPPPELPQGVDQLLVVHGQLAHLRPQASDLLVAVIGRSALEGGLAAGQGNDGTLMASLRPVVICGN